jgi:hypothetical protein
MHDSRFAWSNVAGATEFEPVTPSVSGSAGPMQRHAERVGWRMNGDDADRYLPVLSVNVGSHVAPMWPRWVQSRLVADASSAPLFRNHGSDRPVGHRSRCRRGDSRLLVCDLWP